jgi:hypothetical protein
MGAVLGQMKGRQRAAYGAAYGADTLTFLFYCIEVVCFIYFIF